MTLTPHANRKVSSTATPPNLTFTPASPPPRPSHTTSMWSSPPSLITTVTVAITVFKVTPPAHSPPLPPLPPCYSFYHCVQSHTTSTQSSPPSPPTLLQFLSLCSKSHHQHVVLPSVTDHHCYSFYHCVQSHTTSTQSSPTSLITTVTVSITVFKVTPPAHCPPLPH